MELKRWWILTLRQTRHSFNRTLWNWNLYKQAEMKFSDGLLIVPYGIETRFLVPPISLLFAFNRTLWNWNSVNIVMKHILSKLLIVPYGIEWHSYMCRQVIWGFYCMELKLVKLSCYFIYYDYLIMWLINNNKRLIKIPYRNKMSDFYVLFFR